MLRRNGPVVKSLESVLRLEGSLWGERFVEEVGIETGLKERGSYGWFSLSATGLPVLSSKRGHYMAVVVVVVVVVVVQ